MQFTTHKIKTLAATMLLASATGVLAQTPAENHKNLPLSAHFQLKTLGIGQLKLNDFLVDVMFDHGPYSEYRLMADGIALSDLKYDDQAGTSAGDFSIDKISLSGVDTNKKSVDLAHIDNFSFSSELSYKNGLYPTGSGEMKLGSLYFTHFLNPNKMPHTITVTDFEAKGHLADKKNERTAGYGEVYFKNVSLDNLQFGPMTFKYDFDSNQKAYGQYAAFVRDLRQLKNHLTGKQLSQQQQFRILNMVLLRGQGVLLNLAQHGVDFNIDKFKLETAHGNVEGYLKLHTDDATKVQNPKLIADGHLSAPVATVMSALNVANQGNEQQSKQTLNQWINQGFVVQKGDTLSIDVRFKNKQLMVNGKELTFKPVLTNEQTQQ